MKVQKFEDLHVWQKAQDFAVEIYKSFEQSKDFSFKKQICSAVVSISNNIAEGFDRYTRKDFMHFLVIARSSCSEVRSMLYLARKLEYINSLTQKELLNQSNEISKMLFGLLKSLRAKEEERTKDKTN
ncbi:MAG: four helix bundle protein [Thermoflexibacter sp.]|jgi:four helix bundle protein|nr:four helix bundle protein [Thermoflexibacter sp.]